MTFETDSKPYQLFMSDVRLMKGARLEARYRLDRAICSECCGGL